MGPEAGLSINAHFDEGFLMIPIQGVQDCWSENFTFEERKNSGARMASNAELAHYQNSRQHDDSGRSPLSGSEEPK